LKTLLKLLVAAAILNATWRIGSAYWERYQFQDAVKEAAQFSQRATADQLAGQVLDLADKMDIPLQADDVTVAKERRRTTVDAAYARDIEVFPRVARRWQFAVHVSVLDGY
jgi:alcohol dehydrogenase class IV